VGKSTVTGIVFAATLLAVTAALAQEQGCNARYRFSWGQQSQGYLNIRSGMPCRIQIRMGPRSTISEVKVVSAPSNVSASTSGGAVRVQARAGFKGQDSMSLQYVGTGPNGPGQATVNFAINVR